MYKGFKHSEESKKKMRLAKLGKKPSEDTKKKMSEAQKLAGNNTGRWQKGVLVAPKPFTKGHIPWHKGKKGLVEANIGSFKKGQSPWNKGVRGERKIRPKGYSELHMWMRYHYGSANDCENELCPKISRNYHWALIRGCDYERKRENFMMLCASCHQRYDRLSKGFWFLPKKKRNE